MKIVGVDLTPVASKRETGQFSRHVIIRLSTDEGLIGLGEMSDVMDWRIMYDLQDIKEAYESLLLGKNPLEWKNLTVEGRERFSMGGAIRAGFEIAIFDLVGKFRNQSVADIFGGSLKDKLRVCYPIFRNFTIEMAEENVKRVHRRMKEGQDLFRLYHGGNVDADEIFLDSVRSRWGEKFVLKSLDFSRKFPWKQTIRALERLSQYGPIHLESVSDLREPEGMYEIRRRIDLPISEHVHTPELAFEYAKGRYVDIFNVCLSGTGGFTTAFQIAEIARAAGISCLVGTTQELSIGVAAQAMFGSVLENLDFPGDPTGGLLYESDVVTERVSYENGYLIVPNGPGLGMELDSERLSEITYPLSSVSEPKT